MSGPGKITETAARLAARCAALALILAVALAAAPGEPRPHCEVCRRYWDTSDARIDVSLKFGKTVRNYQLCSLFCYFEFMEDYPDTEPERALIVNHATLDQELPGRLRLENAHFLYEAEGDPEKTCKPFTYAFATRDQAVEAQAELGGELLDFDEARERITELTDDYEPERQLHYSPKNRRPR